MHDLIEKADVSPADMHRRFGAKVTELVLAVSDDDSIKGYARRKAALRRQVAGAGEDALTLFAADKLSKVRELRREVAGDSDTTAASVGRRQVRARRLRHYQRSLALLEERLAPSSLVPQLRDEFRSLVSELPEPALAGSL
jgi:(p)ppGpp synthase/HD superfamily hydrolase